jgi:cytochrome c553
MRSAIGSTILWAAALLVVGCDRGLDLDTSRPTASSPRRGADASLLQEGRLAYATYCAGCHGETGDGNGPAAGFLNPRPRNFQNASFKFSSTRAGKLPTDDDLKRTIRNGLRGSAMPDWPLLSEHTVGALVAHIKTLSPKWTERKPASQIPLTNDPYRDLPDKSEAIARGEVVYHGYATCWSCHPAYVNEAKINEYRQMFETSAQTAFRPNLHLSEGKVSGEGELVYPPDFRRDFVRAGTDAGDLYRSISAGITGTAMPTWVDSMNLKSAHGDVLVKAEDLWAMAYYVRNLLQQRPAKLAEGKFIARPREQILYFNGEIPPPAEDPIKTTTDKEFIEE